MKIQKGFITQKAKNKLIIFDTEKSTLYSFNPTARFIFELIKKGLTTDEVADKMTKKFNVSLDQAKKDINEFVVELKAKEIISR